MLIGSIIKAPEGYKGLSKDIDYHFLWGAEGSRFVRLVYFWDGSEERYATLVSLSRSEFETALVNGCLVKEDRGDIWPYWLKRIEGVAIDYLESQRSNPVNTYVSIVDRRYFLIHGLVQDFSAVLSAEKPAARIGKHARELGQLPARIALWFYTFLVCGMNKWALMPAYCNNGHWPRDAYTGEVKLGKTSKEGRFFGGHSTPQWKEMMERGFFKVPDKQATKSIIYGQVMASEFGCKTRVDRNGETHWFHPDGSAWPTENQFWRFIQGLGDWENYSILRNGKNKTKEKQGSRGRFDDEVISVNQTVEFDGWYPKVKITDVIESAAIDSMCVVRARCRKSGAILGVGFAQAKENLEAYHMALFCMAISKVKFFELFGMELMHPAEWPTKGLPDYFLTDRGPGSAFDGLAEIEWLGSVDIAPTASGQSKATIESSHPRGKDNKDRPGHHHSAMNMIEMAKAQLVQVLKFNKSSKQSKRMTREMWEAGFTPTPNNVYKYYDELGLSNAINITFETAVRKFLTPRLVSVKRDGIYLHARKYNSSILAATGIFDSIAHGGSYELSAYTLTLGLRYIWLEYRGVLYELSAVTTLQTATKDLDISLVELQALDKLRKKAERKLEVEQTAVEQDLQARFYDSTGKHLTLGKWVNGPPSKGAAKTRAANDHTRFHGEKP